MPDTVPGADPIEDLVGERRHLLNLAFRMLGTVHEAEDVVQETCLRWYRLSEEERAAIRVPGAWLTRVASRICLDQLGSARARRERYVGEWLPEPLPAFTAHREDPDPLDRITVDDSVRMALLVVLESLTPAERVSFVLHDVFGMPFGEIAQVVGRSADSCRQLATSARKKIQANRATATRPEQHSAVVAAFRAACESGDIEALVSVLDPSVTARSDGGGFVSAALRPIVGVDNVARFLLGVLAKAGPLDVTEELVNGEVALVVRAGGAVFAIVSLGATDDRVSDVWIVMNPQKLTAWGASTGRVGD
ncbi:RNA polymerase sigma factor SigJ [Glaciihabitans sp. dw_435]|uniref:RNA polymerase sigma factor SigJ n=1 Tax=Glaciihabitans sp. dw_435 TaxID=2720081 RepID=UPI001BD40AE2|nr:RNA polymerase sigma factor SigJ [Glaciihabitans sp. dw_435]